MIITRDDEFDESNDNQYIVISPLKELSNELLFECLKDQFEDPFISTTNHLEEFDQAYKNLAYLEEDNPDIRNELDNIRREFYNEVLDRLEQKFDLAIDDSATSSLDSDALQSLAEGLYQFFIIDYQDNIIHYLKHFVKDNFESLAREILGKREMISEDLVDDVSTKGYAYKLKDTNAIVIISNINLAFKCIKSIGISDNDRFIEYLDEDEFGSAILKHAWEKGIVAGDFIERFLEPISSPESGLYAAASAELQQYIFKKYKRKKFDMENVKDDESEEGSPDDE